MSDRHKRLLLAAAIALLAVWGVGLVALAGRDEPDNNAGLKSRPYVVAFPYVACKDVCPLIGIELSKRSSNPRCGTGCRPSGGAPATPAGSPAA